MRTELEPTGERMIEDAYHRSRSAYVIYLTHSASYDYAQPHCRDKRVLDLGCGSGYGAARMATVAQSVIGVDVAADAVAFARARHSAPNLKFELAEADARLPFDDESFDVVLSFQVIEHVVDEGAYLREARRVLRRGGLILIITPDRQHRLLPGQKPWNRWHLREYSAQSLVAIVAPVLQIEACLRMGAEWEVAGVEIRRYRLTKWLTLPFTLPFVPATLRRRGLDLLHAIKGQGRSVVAEVSGEKPNYGFDERAIKIAAEVTHSLNLVLIAKRSDNGSH
ncbi:MAG: class I SAM-dependent methyltransferase [Pseudomarimonas sp.]